MFFDLLFSQPQREYQIYARLGGMRGPMNCVALTQDGKILASGGDAEAVYIWDIEEQKMIQTLSDRLERWGQITCLKWLRNTGHAVTGHTLCFGTGRGFLLVYDKQKDSETFLELSCAAIFPFNDPVEAVDYDGHKEKLIASSHSGNISMYTLNKKGVLELIWTKSLADSRNGKTTIPRAVHFVASGEGVVVCGLESGIIFSKAAATGNDNWNKQLKSSIGGAWLSPNAGYLLVDNLVKGFDIYTYPALLLMESFEIDRSEVYIHDGTFVEGSLSIACGSDHGQVYVYSCKKSQCVQKLRIGSKKSTIQAIDAISCERQHFLAAGTSDPKPEIIIWRKMVSMVSGGRNRTAPKWDCSALIIMMVFNALIVIAVTAWMTRSDLRTALNTMQASSVDRWVKEPERETQQLREQSKETLTRTTSKYEVDIYRADWREQLLRARM